MNFYQEKLRGGLLSNTILFPLSRIFTKPPLNASPVLRALIELLLLNFHHSPCVVGIKIPVFQHKEMATQRVREMTILAFELEGAGIRVHIVLQSKEGPQSTKNVMTNTPFQGLSVSTALSR